MLSIASPSGSQWNCETVSVNLVVVHKVVFYFDFFFSSGSFFGSKSGGGSGQDRFSVVKTENFCQKPPKNPFRFFCSLEFFRRRPKKACTTWAPSDFLFIAIFRPQHSH